LRGHVADHRLRVGRLVGGDQLRFRIEVHPDDLA
jgi:hypothetical protein